jgi:diguanylate cyclase (GGDEF)-like protein
MPGTAYLVHAWANALAPTGEVPMSSVEVERFLHRLTCRLGDALTSQPFRPRLAYDVGTELVGAQFVGAEALGRSLRVIGCHLTSSIPSGPGDQVPPDTGDRLAAVQEAVASGYVQALRDQTRSEQRRQARHDPLTGLPNRTRFFERLAAALAEPGARVGVCHLDLDGFKAVNDTLGHDIGDLLLVAVGRRLDSCAGARGHLVARMGGDEFAVLVERSAGTDPVTGLADALLAALDAPVQVAEHSLAVSASMGVVERPADGTTPAEVMKAADTTLYWAKSDGRGRWAVFDPQRNAREVTRHTLRTTMRAGLDAGEFTVDYQPLVRLADGAPRGVEALVRWRHPALGTVPPDQFIGLAEETGLIVPLGRWILEQACRHARDWQREFPGADFFVSVNLAVRQAHDPGLVDDVAGILVGTGLTPGLLQLELTESAVMGTTGRPVQALEALAGMGVRIAIDDFGTGYSNLAYLRRLPVHTLKLAGPFVEAFRGDDPDEPVVTSLVRLAHTLGLTVTAEGVENADQAGRLRELGCDLAQGWYFARPLPPGGVTALLRERFASFRY